MTAPNMRNETAVLRDAAPDMLGALQIISNLSVRHDKTDSKALALAVREARAAIAKTEGEPC